MVVAGTAQIGVIEERRLAAVFGRRLVALLGQEGCDAFAIERAKFEGAGRGRLDTDRIDAPIRAQDAKAGPEALFGMRPTGQLIGAAFDPQSASKADPNSCSTSEENY